MRPPPGRQAAPSREPGMREDADKISPTPTIARKSRPPRVRSSDVLDAPTGDDRGADAGQGSRPVGGRRNVEGDIQQRASRLHVVGRPAAGQKLQSAARRADRISAGRHYSRAPAPISLVSASVALGHYPGSSVEEAYQAWTGRLANRTPGHHRSRASDGRTTKIGCMPFGEREWIITYEDISARINAEEALAEQNKRLTPP